MINPRSISRTQTHHETNKTPKAIPQMRWMRGCSLSRWTWLALLCAVMVALGEPQNKEDGGAINPAPASLLDTVRDMFTSLTARIIRNATEGAGDGEHGVCLAKYKGYCQLSSTICQVYLVLPVTQRRKAPREVEATMQLNFLQKTVSYGAPSNPSSMVQNVTSSNQTASYPIFCYGAASSALYYGSVKA